MTYTYMHYFAEMYYYHSAIAWLQKDITLSPDAQRFQQKIKDLGAFDLTDKNITSKIPEIYWETAVQYNMHLFPEDLDYINNKIRPNPIFKLIPQDNAYGTAITVLSHRLVFHENLLTDETMPKGLKTVITVYNLTNYALTTKIKKKKIKVYNYVNAHRPYIERWFEMVNLTH